MYPYNLENDDGDNIEQKEYRQMKTQNPDQPVYDYDPYRRPMPDQHNPSYRPIPEPEHFPEYMPPDHRKGPDRDQREHNDREKPLGAPPHAIPTKRTGSSVYAVDPGAIRNCLYNYTYVWLHNGSSFWMYPTFVGRKSVSGYRWSRFGWVYTGLDLDMIETFFCTPY